MPCHIRVNKHKPWIETSYHGVITENNDTVILDPPLVALDKDAPVPFADQPVISKLYASPDCWCGFYITLRFFSLVLLPMRDPYIFFF
ncbi:Calsyntenin-2 [Camelus dromedarius]|uniref:Calsyntenin-2 n=1 Tax=Camelus dromedarius TaxID=9838 RepID=A0A5N4EJA1_CAMDR|nr:Calsyntenin-2 [Camelus dromedarius]